MFTLAVLAAVPLLPATTKAATVGSTATATKSGSAAGSAAGTGWLGLFAGLSVISFGYFIRYRVELEGATSDLQRRQINRFYVRLFAAAVPLFATTATAVFQRLAGDEGASRWLTSLLTGAFLTFAAMAVTLSLRMLGRYLRQPANPSAHGQPILEYRSRREFLGWPLAHVRLGGQNTAPVRAWFAVGEIAWGRLFAFGGIAIAPFFCFDSGDRPDRRHHVLYWTPNRAAPGPGRRAGRAGGGAARRRATPAGQSCPHR